MLFVVTGFSRLQPVVALDVLKGYPFREIGFAFPMQEPRLNHLKAVTTNTMQLSGLNRW